MTAKEYLQQYGRLASMIDAKIEQKARLLSRAQYVSPNGGSLKSGRPYDKVGELTKKILTLEAEIRDEIDDLIDLQREIENRIAALPDPIHRDILEKRYINCWSIKKIAKRRDCSVETVYKEQRAALESFTDYYSFSVV